MASLLECDVPSISPSADWGSYCRWSRWMANFLLPVKDGGGSAAVSASSCLISLRFIATNSGRKWITLKQHITWSEPVDGMKSKNKSIFFYIVSFVAETAENKNEFSNVVLLVPNNNASFLDDRPPRWTCGAFHVGQSTLVFLHDCFLDAA